MAMVDGGGFMIDATEVGNGQYAELLEVDFNPSAATARTLLMAS